MISTFCLAVHVVRAWALWAINASVEGLDLRVLRPAHGVTSLASAHGPGAPRSTCQRCCTHHSRPWATLWAEAGRAVARSEIASDRLDDRRRVLERLAHLCDLHRERLVLALIAEVAEGVELVEVRADAEVVERGLRVFARFRMPARPSPDAVPACGPRSPWKASVESEAMIVSAEAMCRRATSISARAVAGSGATSRSLFSARSFRTSASAIDLLDEWDQGMVRERADEPGRVRLPL